MLIENMFCSTLVLVLCHPLGTHGEWSQKYFYIFLKELSKHFDVFKYGKRISLMKCKHYHQENVCGLMGCGGVKNYHIKCIYEGLQIYLA